MGQKVTIFRSFLSVFISSHGSKQRNFTKKWDSSGESPISRAGDIAYNEEERAEYYAGMQTSNDKRLVVGYT